ncbi:uncharacterized protein LOC134716754 [Mytilus trossulus]|uniref:uncharacterized protein LOC134716754 n=1 Tax=Mytilus trossulus TaxID=6551 RepID=UPI0030057F9B
MSYILVIINAIVVVLMAVYINVNERRFQEMSTNHDRTGQYIENMVRNLTVDISDDIRRISDEQIAEKVQNIENVVRILTVGISDDIRRISNEQIAEKGKKKNGFLVRLKGPLENQPKGSVVIYDDVITNNGNGYSPSTGIFTASDEGLYSFSWTTTTQVNKHFFTYLAVNGNMIARNHAQSVTINSSASQTVVVHLKTHDKVKVKVQDDYVGLYIFPEGTQNIGFLVSLESHTENRPKGSIVIYDKVITNDDNGYNPSTGIFTASAEGLYSFSWTTTTKANKYFFIYLTVNGHMIARNHAGHGNVDLSASQAVVVHLKKNDKVSIKVQDNSVGQYIYGKGWSTFSGFMI